MHWTSQLVVNKHTHAPLHLVYYKFTRMFQLFYSQYLFRCKFLWKQVLMLRTVQEHWLRGKQDDAGTSETGVAVHIASCLNSTWQTMMQCNEGTTRVTVQALYSHESLLNRFWTDQGPCRASLHKWKGSHPITFLWLWPASDHEPHCRHVPTNKIWRRLNLLHDADDDAVIWLESTATAALAKWMNSHEKEEVGLQTCTEDWYRGCQSDVMRQTVSGTSGSNRKCSVTDDGKARVTDDQWLIDWLIQGFTSHLTQNRSFQRRSSQPISWRSIEETKPNTKKANNARTKQFKLNQKNTQNTKPKHTHKN